MSIFKLFGIRKRNYFQDGYNYAKKAYDQNPSRETEIDLCAKAEGDSRDDEDGKEFDQGIAKFVKEMNFDNPYIMNVGE